jgi:1-acyl-sn-glycerol-3-phosphate acyltransferase
MNADSAKTTAKTARKPLSPLRTAYECLIYYGGLALFGGMCLGWSLAAYPLAWLLRRRGAAFGRRAIRFGFSAYLRVLEWSGIIECDLAALDALQHERSLIIAPNHPSLIDVVLIASRLPNVVCIMKKTLADRLMFGGSAKLAGYIRSVSNTRMVSDAVQEIATGSQLLIFPEGTRTAGAGLQPFKGGFALIARRAKAPVQTVFIDINHPFLSKDRPLFCKPDFPLRFRVRLGKRFPPPDDVQSGVSALQNYCAEQLAQASRDAP